MQQVILMAVHTADADETKPSCLVRVGGVNTTSDKTTQFYLVSTQFPNDLFHLTCADDGILRLP